MRTIYKVATVFILALLSVVIAHVLGKSEQAGLFGAILAVGGYLAMQKGGE